MDFARSSRLKSTSNEIQLKWYHGWTAVAIHFVAGALGHD